MSWIKWLIRSLNRSKMFMLYVFSIVLLIVGMYFYNHSQELRTIPNLSTFVTEQTNLINVAINNVNFEKEIDATFDQDDAIIDNLKEQSKALYDLNGKLFNQDYFIAPELKQYYQLVLDDGIQSNNIPSGVWKDDAIRELAKATYMEANQLSMIEEDVPINSSIFSFQVFNVLFSIVTILLVVFILGNQLINEVHDHRFTLYYALPIRRKLLQSMDQIRISYTAIVTLVISLFSFIPMVISGNFQSFLYPYVAQKGELIQVIPMWKMLGFKILFWIIALYFIHLIALVMLRCFKSLESQIIFTVIIGCLLIIIMNQQQWQFFNPLSYLFQQDLILLDRYKWIKLLMIGLILMIGYGLLHYSTFMERLIIVLSKDHSRQKYHLVSKIQEKLPTWMSFEWVKRLRLMYVSRLLLATITFVLVFYGAMSYLSVNRINYFEDYLIQSIVGNEQNQLLREMIKYDGLRGMLSNFKNEYESEKEDNESFETWYSEYDPAGYDFLNEPVEASIKLDQLYRETIHSISEGTFQSKDLLAFQLSENTILKENMFIGDTFEDQLMSDARFDYYQTNEQAPLFDMSFFNAPYTDFPLEVSKVRKTPIEHSSTQVFYRFIQLHGATLIVIFMVFALLSTIADERYPNDHWKLISTLPRKKSSLYFAKWRYNLLSVVGGLSVLLIGVFILFSVLGGTGDFSYPVRVYDAAQVGQLDTYQGYYPTFEKLYFHLTNLGTYLIHAFLLVGALGMFLSSFGLFLSTFIRKKSLLLIILVISCVIGYWQQIEHITSQWSVYSPFIYFNIREVMDGWLASLSNQGLITPLFGGVVLFVWSIVFTLLGYILWRWQTRNRQNRKEQA